MKTKVLIGLLERLPQEAEVMIEVGGCAMYTPVGSPYVRRLGVNGMHDDFVCIGADIKVNKYL